MMEEIRFLNNRQRPLNGRIYGKLEKSAEGVIFSHGLFSSKDGYKITRIAESIALAGFPLMTFDFSFAAGSEQGAERLSVLQEVEDLAAAAEFFERRGACRIHFVGSSMGAAVTLLYLARRPAHALSFAGIATPADLRGLVTMNSPVKDFESLPEGGTTDLGGVNVGNGFFREIAGIDMEGALSRLAVPVLLIHGGRDTVVPPYNTELVKNGAAVPVATVIIDDGDHNLVRDADIETIRESLIGWFGASGRGGRK